VLLHDGANAVVHLLPAPVVARVATTTASDLLLRGPHRHDELTVSSRRHLDLLPEPPTAAEAGAALGELQEVLASLPPLWEGSVLDTPLEDLAAFAEQGTTLGADPPGRSVDVVGR
jgi:hypothetical protein